MGIQVALWVDKYGPCNPFNGRIFNNEYGLKTFKQSLPI